MSTAAISPEVEQSPSKLVFWGCWIALITTAFAFISRAFMINTPSMWPADFGIDKVQGQELFGAGLWPFAVSIILFSLVIDKIGYRIAMLFSFVCYALYAGLALWAYSIVKVDGLAGEELLAAQKSGLSLLTYGSIILGLGNGTVEAFINPVVATMFSKEKTKWLNIGLGSYAGADWRMLIYIIAIPAVIYLLMLIGAKFPVSERVAGGATYREMLAEFGAIGALIASFLMFREIGGVFKIPDMVVWIAMAAAVIGYGAYCRSLGRPLMIFLCLIMMPLATTELGTDGAISGLMEKPMAAIGGNGLWVLIYTSFIMMVLRFFAGPVIKAFTPLGLLAICSALAMVGIYSLSMTTTAISIFLAATLYGVAKTYFWPTMLGVVAEQFPRGGAVTLNAIAGIGMLTVGIIGGPMIGKMQEDSAMVALEAAKPGVYQTIQKEDSNLFLGSYTAVDDKLVESHVDSEEIVSIVSSAKQGALAKMCLFPGIMLVCYLILIAYFKSQGGYKPAEFGASSAH